jgi:long-subunit fatty acid transport protein
MSESLQASSTFKVGGEYRIQDLSLRAGYRYEQSPYKNETTIGNLDGYSAGLGYNFGNIKLDLAYDNASRTDNPQHYQVGLINTAQVKRDFSNVILSLSFGI